MVDAAATVQSIGPSKALEPSTPVDTSFPYPFPEFKPWLCCICDHIAAPWAPYYCCRHWPSGEPDNPWERPYNANFTEGEARLTWAIYQIATKGLAFFMDRPIPPLPGTGSQRVLSKQSGTLFQRVKEAIAVKAMAERFTQLYQASPGRWKGKCPLHEEHTPSFYVYEDSEYWRCYGACARGGDVIELARLLMDAGRLN